MNKIIIYVIYFTLCVCFSSFAETVNDVNLKLAIKQVQDGKEDSQIHYLELTCQGASCIMTTISFGKCDGKGNPTYPVLEISSTSQGNLRVISHSSNRIVLEETMSDMGGVSRINYMFEYSGSGIQTVTGFSGGFVKNSEILNKVLTVEYIALDAEPNGYPQIKSCDIAFPGVSKT